MIIKPAIGIATVAVAIVLCFTAVASDSTPTEKVSAVDATQYADFMANETLDMQDLAENAEDQRRLFDRITPPGFSWIQPMLPAVVPFNADNFDDKFLADLLGEDMNSVAVYPLSLSMNPKTRETLIFNAKGKLIASVPADKDVPGWPENAGPSRVTLRLDLLPSEDVEPYLYTESRITESRVSKSAKAKGAAMKSLAAGEFGIVGVEPMTNGSMRLTVSNGTDVAEVYAYTVLHTSATVVVTWTNEQSNVVTDTNTLWFPVSPPFNGIESAWESQTTNLLLTNGVGAWEDAGIPSNARVRFYAAVKGGDADHDNLTNSEEIFVYHTYPDVTDTDGDGLPDGWEVQNGLDPLDADGNNGPEGDLDGDGFNNILEFELDAPANNPAWNGHELAYRLTHAHTVVVTNTRSITTNLIGMRVTVTNSWDCETGGHPGRQNNTDYLVVSNLLEPGYYIDITMTGSVEDVDEYYDEVTFEAFTNTFYFMSHDGIDDETEEEDCFMVDEGATRNNLILANSTVYLRYDTVGYKWHHDAYAEIIAATNTGILKVDLDIAGTSDADEETVGGFVPVNADNDNGSTVTNHIPFTRDFDASNYTDNDLVPLSISVEPATGLFGTLRLRKVEGGRDRIKVWESTDKAADVTLPKTWTLGTDMIPPTLYVEGLKEGESMRDIDLVLEYLQGDRVICNDKVNVTVTPVLKTLSVAKRIGASPGYYHAGGDAVFTASGGDRDTIAVDMTVEVSPTALTVPAGAVRLIQHVSNGNHIEVRDANSNVLAEVGAALPYFEFYLYDFDGFLGQKLVDGGPNAFYPGNPTGSYLLNTVDSPSLPWDPNQQPGPGEVDIFDVQYLFDLYAVWLFDDNTVYFLGATSWSVHFAGELDENLSFSPYSDNSINESGDFTLSNDDKKTSDPWATDKAQWFSVTIQ